MPLQNQALDSPCSPGTVGSINMLFFSQHPRGNRLSTLPKASKTSTRRSAHWLRTRSRPQPGGRWGSCGCRRGRTAESLGPEAGATGAGHVAWFVHSVEPRQQSAGALSKGPATGGTSLSLPAPSHLRMLTYCAFH